MTVGQHNECLRGWDEFSEDWAIYFTMAAFAHHGVDDGGERIDTPLRGRIDLLSSYNYVALIMGDSASRVKTKQKAMLVMLLNAISPAINPDITQPSTP
jgi:hypothetical protein